MGGALTLEPEHRYLRYIRSCMDKPARMRAQASFAGRNKLPRIHGQDVKTARDSKDLQDNFSSYNLLSHGEANVAVFMPWVFQAARPSQADTDL